MCHSIIAGTCLSADRTDRSARADTWRAIREGRVLGAGVAHLRRTSTRAHASIRFCPGGQNVFCLNPVNHGCLIAPVQKPGHDRLVSTRRHIVAHALLAVPRGHGPECPASISQQTATLESRRSFDLTQRAERMHCEEWKEANGTDFQARNADESHTSPDGFALLLPVQFLIPLRLTTMLDRAPSFPGDQCSPYRGRQSATGAATRLRS